MRSTDWSSTPLGEPSRWSQTLRTTVGLLLRNHSGLLLLWGPEFVQLYNDAYRPLLGDKHPRSMGQRARDCAPETWHIIRRFIEAPFLGEPATAQDDLFLILDRKGFLEETHFKVAWSPVPDESIQPSGIGGVLVTVAETTEQVYAQRQLRTLRELGTRTAEAKTAEQACAGAAAALAENSGDVPFAMLYLLDADRRRLTLACKVGFDDGPSSAAPEEIDVVDDRGRWPLAAVIAGGRAKVIRDLAECAGIPRGPWERPTDTAIALPLASPEQAGAYGVLVCGVNPHRAFDDGYRSFFELAAAQIVAAIGSARAYQAERKRAEAMTVIDRSTEDDLAAARILVADDNLHMREYLTRLLAQRWSVEAVPDGDAALAALRKERFDLLLTDVMMPGSLDGFRLVQALRSQPALCHLPVIVLSACAGEEARVEGLELGADDYLIKPFSARELIARVETHLRLARRRQEIEGNRAKDEFLAMLGHELRNPLTPILATLQLMRMEDENKFAKQREVIERQARHLARLVDDLLDVSRITRGKLELKRAEVELGAIVSRAIEVATPLLEERGHFLRVNVEPGALVDADECRMVQVVSNLLINAAKYTDPGGRIEICVRSEAGSVVLRVRDDGMGIPGELLPHVFDLFRQGRQSSARPLGGLGLGLSIVRSIVELHGGEVSAASGGPGTGSEFTVRLPRVRDKRASKKRTLLAPASHSGGSPGRILVVDDNRDIADVLARLLRERGHDVAVAYDGPSALAAITANPPQVALLDIGLPAIDGYELARRIRAQKKTRHVELIAITGYGQACDIARATEAGFSDHATKPFDVAQLLSIVELRLSRTSGKEARQKTPRRARRTATRHLDVPRS